MDQLDYDTVSYIVIDVIDGFFLVGWPKLNELLKVDCNIGEALRGQVTARVRYGLPVFDGNLDVACDWLAGVIEFANKKSLHD